MYWPALTETEIRERVFEALAANVSYRGSDLLGVPGSYLDGRVFRDAPFLRDAPLLSAMVENPNHIGCHTFGASESMFAGTQRLELELLALCAEEILGAAPRSYDGYVSSGGTESNIQALWCYRNEFRKAHGLGSSEVAVLQSTDTHYSVVKACDMLGTRPWKVPVDKTTRRVEVGAIAAQWPELRRAGVRALVVVLNMGTTMFGSIDDPEPVLSAVAELGVPFRVHVDAAFGGFIHPFSSSGESDDRLSFRDERITSFTLDAHKMLGAPYGTGIFLARGGLMEYVETSGAHYVKGLDNTVCGSRSGANAIAVWMILRAYGSEGGREYVRGLLATAEKLTQELDALGVRYFREPRMNIVTMRAADVPEEVARAFYLVPDVHGAAPAWWKIAVMDHVDDEAIAHFVAALRAAR